MKIEVGEVSNVNDPDKLGRVKVTFSTIIDGEWPNWFQPIYNFFGEFSTPKSGDKVLCLILSSDPDLTKDTWEFCLGTLNTTKKEMLDVWKKNYPKRKGFETPGGCRILVDDFRGSELIEIHHPDGTEILLKDGKVYLGAETGAGRLVRFDEMKTLFNKHVHKGVTTGAGVTDIPDVAVGLMTDAQATSKTYAS